MSANYIQKQIYVHDCMQIKNNRCCRIFENLPTVRKLGLLQKRIRKEHVSCE